MVGPSYGGGGGSRAWRARLDESAAFLAPLLLIGGLALAGGGFDLSERHIAGLAVWLAVVAMLVLGAAGRAALGKPFYWSAGLIGVVAIFSASSSLWSGSVELSVIEADRVLVYLGVFLAAFLIAQTDQRRQRFAEGVAIALAGIALLALVSRLLPDLSIGDGPGTGARLSYPLGYWNADGIAFATAAALLLWLSRNSLATWLRWAAAAMLPAVLLALYLTYSRGGVLALAVACGCLIALSHDRLWMLATLAIGTLGAVPAVLAVQSRRALAENLGGAADQGLAVLAFLIAGTLIAVALFAVLRRLERRGGGLAGRALELSRNPRVLRWIAAALALLAIAGALAVAGRAWDQFSNPELVPAKPEERFGDFSGAGRNDYWRVALDSGAEAPLIGHGAGTYQFSWDELREIQLPVLDAHSLYLEAFSELGLIGGLAVLGAIGAVLWAGFAAWRHDRGARRELYAALLAACLAFAVGAAIDWFWEIAAIGAVFFLAGGVLVAARCAQLAALCHPEGDKVHGGGGEGWDADAGGNDNGTERTEQSRYGLAVAGLAVAWIAALALIGPLLVDREINASKAAAADGNIAAAVDHAETARTIEPWAARPYVQLALLAEFQGDSAAAIERFGEAIDREDRNWLLYYLRARVERNAGDLTAARADRLEALRLNPLEKCLGEGWEGCG